MTFIQTDHASPAAWQTELAAGFSDPDALLAYLGLAPAAYPEPGSGAAQFPFRVTRSYAARMEPANPADPLLLQVLPQVAETIDRDGFLADPVGDVPAAAAPGVLHKYHGRVLLVVTGACAIHCRYCFRREFPYGDHLLSRRREREALDYLAAHDDVTEVILSGGDPLVLADERLASLITELSRIPHLRRLRIHSRLPVVLPSRLTPELADILGGSRLAGILVIHANHPAEVDTEVREGLSRLRAAGVVLLNQAVLLRGINDSVESLAGLSERLFESGVLPYYLHLLDRARGTAHFEVDESRALALLESLRKRLPGYLVPKLVREVAGEGYKRPIG